MRFVVTVTATFRVWFEEQDRPLQRAILMHVRRLGAHGPALGRPYADTLKGSKLANLKELRVQHRSEPDRILFAFDPRRQAVLLLGGRKTGDHRWYLRAIREAENLFEQHLETLHNREDGENGS